MSERRALWVSTSTKTRGGIATYVRDMQSTPLWAEWNIRHVATHQDGPVPIKLAQYLWGAVLFIADLIGFRPDVVHLHTSADSSFIRKCILFWVGQAAGVPAIVHVHASDFSGYYDDSSRLVKWMIRITLCRAAAVVALGEVLASRLRSIAPGAQVTAIPNAVRTARRIAQPLADEPVRVAFLGRIGDRKGTFRLIDAWAKLSCDPDFETGHHKIATLTIAGDGEVDRARRLIREHCLEDSAEVCPWLSQHEVEELLDHSHVLVLPSRNEGQPMAVLEAMARGLCVISSDVGGLAEMIDGGCGLVVPPDDVEAITAALRCAIHDDDRRARLGDAAYERIRSRFDIDIVWHRLDSLYRDVTG